MTECIDVELAEYIGKEIIYDQYDRFSKISKKTSENAVRIEKDKNIYSGEDGDTKGKRKNRIPYDCVRPSETVSSELFPDFSAYPAVDILTYAQRTQE